jgi:hypothetical protein
MTEIKLNMRFDNAVLQYWFIKIYKFSPSAQFGRFLFYYYSLHN